MTVLVAYASKHGATEGIATFIALGVLMALGGDVLFDFAFALFLGILVGTYSSIFVASALAYVWRRR